MADFLMPKNQNLVIKRYDYRLTFEKMGRARYISHLDLMRAMQRAFKRAGIPLWYTQGFNPHAYLNFPLALALGIESRIEVLDVSLTEEMDFDELTQRLNAVMPEGIRIVKTGKAIRKHTEIAFADYDVKFSCSGKSAEETVELFNELLERESIEIEKRSKKKGINLVDIKPHITLKSIKAVDENFAEMEIRLPAGCEFNLNVSVVMDAFCKYENVEIDSIYTIRTKIGCKDGEDFI
ncbi:MAG: TIGR03936 family radical SAM-associated protein [Oscillospiraceae bacterium]